MSNIILVAGNSTESLGRFLKDRGSVEVAYSFNDLYSNSDRLTNGIYRADKLVYLNQDESIDIRRDMQTLRNLLIGEGFFSVNEIIFFSVRKESNTMDVEYFQAAMKDVERAAEINKAVIVPDYVVNEFDSALSYDRIYNSLLGITETIRLANRFETVYMTDRNTESKNSYPEEDTSDVTIEPFSYKSLNNYEITKESYLKAESNELILESNESNIDKIGVEFDQIEIPDTSTPKIVIVSGPRKSGVSMYSSVLAVSTSARRKKVLILDMTTNKAIYPFMDKYMPINKVDLKHILVGTSVDFEEGISILYDYPEKLSLFVLRHMISNLSRIKVDYIILDVHEEYLKHVCPLCNSLNPSMFIVSRPNLIDLLETKKLFEYVDKADLILNKHMVSDLEMEDVPPEEIKLMFKKLNRLVSPIKFNSIASDGYLSEQLLGV